MSTHKFRKGDLVKITATVDAVHGESVVVRYSNGRHYYSASDIELVKRALPEFKPGGILRYTDPYTDGTVDYIVVNDQECVRVGDPGYQVHDETRPVVALIPIHPYKSGAFLLERFTYFPPGTENDNNGISLG